MGFLEFSDCFRWNQSQRLSLRPWGVRVRAPGRPLTRDALNGRVSSTCTPPTGGFWWFLGFLEGICREPHWLGMVGILGCYSGVSPGGWKILGFFGGVGPGGFGFWGNHLPEPRTLERSSGLRQARGKMRSSGSCGGVLSCSLEAYDGVCYCLVLCFLLRDCGGFMMLWFHVNLDDVWLCHPTSKLLFVFAHSCAAVRLGVLRREGALKSAVWGFGRPLQQLGSSLGCFVVWLWRSGLNLAKKTLKSRGTG